MNSHIQSPKPIPLIAALVFLALVLTIPAFFLSGHNFTGIRVNLHQSGPGKTDRVKLHRPQPFKVDARYVVLGDRPIDATLRILVNGRVLHEIALRTPGAPGREKFVIPAKAFTVGDNTLSFEITPPSDRVRVTRMRLTNYEASVTKFLVSYILWDEMLNGPEDPDTPIENVFRFGALLITVLGLLLTYHLTIYFLFFPKLSDCLRHTRRFFYFPLIVLWAGFLFSLFSPYHVVMPYGTLMVLLLGIPTLTQVVPVLVAGQHFTRLQQCLVPNCNAGARLNQLEPFLDRHCYALFAVFGFLTIPWSLKFPCTGVDCSYDTGFYLAALNHLQHGVDVVFTYGPYYYLTYHNPYYFEYSHWVANNLLVVITHILFVTSLAIFCKKMGTRPALLLFVILIASMEEFLISPKMVLSATIIFYLVSQNRIQKQWKVPAIMFCAFFMALASLSKLTMMAAGGFLLIVLILLSIWHRESRQAGQALLFGFFYILFLAVLWKTAGQELANVPDFLKGGYHQVEAYSEVRTLPARTENLFIGLATLAGAVVLLVLSIHKREKTLVDFALLFSGLLYIEFKNAYVAPRYPTEFISTALMLITLFWILLDSRSDSTRQVFNRFLIPFRILVLVLILWISRNGLIHHSLFTSLPSLQTAFQLYGDAPAQAGLVAKGKQQLREEYRLDPAILKSIGNRSMDIFPWELSLPYAYDLNLKHRPVFQSYTTYTPYLDHLNAKYLSRDTAPEMLLYGYQSLDNRYPLFDEPETFMTVWNHYEVAGRTEEYLLLERKTNAPPTVSPVSLSQTRLKFGEPVTIPPYSDGYVFAKVDMDLNPLGKLMKLLYKPGRPFIEFELNPESRGFNRPQYRFVRNVGMDGLLVSEYIENLDDLEKLFLGEMRHEVRAIRFTTERPSHYRDTIEVKFYGIPRTDPQQTQ